MPLERIYVEVFSRMLSIRWRHGVASYSPSAPSLSLTTSTDKSDGTSDVLEMFTTSVWVLTKIADKRGGRDNSETMIEF